VVERQDIPAGYKWLLDQNIPEAIGAWLEELGLGLIVNHVKKVNMTSASDETIFEFAQRDKWLIVTFDEDFADRRVYPLGSHCGVIRLRIWPTTIEEIQAALLRLLNQFSISDLYGALVIIDRRHIRVRRA
jgi:predicted nuclease of predicted toxin-antitoxin system